MKIIIGNGFCILNFPIIKWKFKHKQCGQQFNQLSYLKSLKMKRSGHKNAFLEKLRNVILPSWIIVGTLLNLTLSSKNEWTLQNHMTSPIITLYTWEGLFTSIHNLKYWSLSYYCSSQFNNKIYNMFNINSHCFSDVWITWITSFKKRKKKCDLKLIGHNIWLG